MNQKMKCALSTLVLLTFSSMTAAASTRYTVASNDTLWKISQNFKVTVDSIKSFNNLISDNIYVGQNMIIPSPGQDYTVYTVVPGDTLWIISQKFKTTVGEIKLLNNLITDSILIGQKLRVPVQSIEQVNTTTYKVAAGDTLWIISKKFNTTIPELKSLNNLLSDYLYIGQILTIPLSNNSVTAADTGTSSDAGSTSVNTDGQETRIEYITYTVKQGDNPWNIGQQFKIPYQEVLKANNLTESTNLKIGQTLKIPVHIVPVKSTPGAQYGELLDWWTEAQYVFYTGAAAKVTDFYTGMTFKIKRTAGANHADCETVSAEDTKIMKTIWGSNWQWINRPVIIELDGRRLAASMSGMPHAGVDSYPALANVANRSGNYGYGVNFDYIKGNNMDGHFDVHFLNSTRHKDGAIDTDHQSKIHIASGQ